MPKVRKFSTNADTFKFMFKGEIHRFNNKAFETSDTALADYVSTLDQVKEVIEVVEKVVVVTEPTPPVAPSTPNEPANSNDPNQPAGPSEEELKAQEKAKQKELKAQEKVNKSNPEGQN